ncbi:MAG: Histidine--tRNA ligase [Alphaproteobacteria bacterium MarineAlpha9_Bin4]|nr:histidine--tRNA ligase [Pelagibacterales bacterium]PPR26630.1 MAG: Histidine--tRNA ligase [Alphaproteobacteria bacterium MarineAlpha9_Bin4]|tara:strand:+ start:821 stop:2065 length:1245 start_codon:yes stop_codon:yes gene_type:complete
MNNKKIASVRGMHDIFGEDHYKQQDIIDNFIKVVSLFNFSPINTPIMEHSEVFIRSLGNVSDVVMKEMYSFLDKSKDSVTLRPEGTAGIARALVSNGLTQNLPQRYFYHGPMFRYERPQQGRLRQFHQVGIELFGKGSYFEDCEVIRIAYFFLKNLNILDKVLLKINTIGKSSSRNNFINEIKSYFNLNKKKLSSDSLKRLEKNPLRILDSKDPQDQDLLKEAPIIYNFLSKDELDNFENIKSLLSSIGISFIVDPFLVRGLDYYSDTTFEFTLKENQKFAILAGGRYNDLVKELGGSQIPGIGWAAGIERLKDLVVKIFKNISPVLLIPTEKKYLTYIFDISNKMFLKGINNQIIDFYNLKKSLKYANKNNAKIAIIVGEHEFNNFLVSYKNLDSGEQSYLDQEELFNKLRYA